MKTPIEIKDIRKGDLIRFEFAAENSLGVEAVEYISPTPGEGYQHTDCGVHYLLDRPEPPFEPYWGMTIANPDDDLEMAVCTGAYPEELDWIGKDESLKGVSWFGHDWAEEKLASGWVVIEKPEGVK